MIVEHRQRITTTPTQSEITFEVHLPQVVRLWMYEADPRFMFKCFFIGQQMVPIQNAGNRTGAGYLSVFSMVPKTRLRVVWSMQRFENSPAVQCRDKASFADRARETGDRKAGVMRSQTVSVVRFADCGWTLVLVSQR